MNFGFFDSKLILPTGLDLTATRNSIPLKYEELLDVDLEGREMGGRDGICSIKLATFLAVKPTRAKVLIEGKSATTVALLHRK